MINEINKILEECDNYLRWGWDIDLELNFAPININHNRLKLAETWKNLPLLEDTKWGHFIKQRCNQVATDLFEENYGRIREDLQGL